MHKLVLCMTVLLDMKTVMILIVLGHLFSLLLISAYWRTHTKDQILSKFLLAKLTQGFAWMLIVVRNGIPDVYTMSIANSLLFIGFALETVAMLRLMQAFNRSAKVLYIVLTLGAIVGYLLVIVFNNHENIRIAEASIGTALFMVVPAYFMILSKAASYIMKLIGLLYIFTIVSLIGRAIVALVSDQTIGMFTPGIYQTFTFLALFLIMFIGNIGFVLLLKEQADQELIRLANYDDLTGIFNRRTFVSLSKQMIAEYAKKREPLSLVLFDIDHFKKINDTYGHHIGDRALQQLAKRIRSMLRGTDSFSRYGGDEFAILLPGADESEADRMVEAFRQSTTQILIPDMASSLSISLGVVTLIPTEQTRLETLYKLCDKALYDAKHNGRNGAARTRSVSLLG